MNGMDRLYRLGKGGEQRKPLRLLLLWPLTNELARIGLRVLGALGGQSLPGNIQAEIRISVSIGERRII